MKKGMIKIAVVEDDRVQQEYLVKELYQYYDAHEERAEIEVFSSAEELLFSYPEGLPFSCLFLDIKLKEMDGMHLARRVRKEDQDIEIIFITGDKNFVFDGYRVRAARYLLKPYSAKDLAEALEYVSETKKKSQPEEESFVIKIMGDFVKLKRSEIFSVEVKGHYISLNTAEKHYEYKESMKNIREQLGTDGFAMANRSVLVGLANVERITKTECFMGDGSTIRVSRGCYRELNQQFIAFYSPLK